MFDPEFDRLLEATHAQPMHLENDRIAATTAGAVLAGFALARRGPFTLPALLVGAALIYRGVKGHFPFDAAAESHLRTHHERVSVPAQQGIHATRSVIINRTPSELYFFWRVPGNLPKVMNYIDSVEVTDDRMAHWKIKLPGGLRAEFDVEVYTDAPGEVISWRSLPKSSIANAGSVRFFPNPEGEGTEVRLTLEFIPPGGALGQAVLKLFGDFPAEYLGKMLDDLKQQMESGEVSRLSD